MRESSEFNNASDAHRAALAAWKRERELRQEIQAGLDSGEPLSIGDLDAFMETCTADVLKVLRGDS